MQRATAPIADLIQQAKAGEQAAFAELYRFAITPIYRYLSARLNTVEEAEELTQDVFVAAIAQLPTLRADTEAAFLKWLLQIAHHKLTDHLRRRYRRPTAPLAAADLLAAREPGPSELAEAAEEHVAVRQALERLTAEQRDVMIFKYVLGYDNERTAHLVGKTINAVNQLHHRALASLRRLLTHASAR